MLIRGPLTGTGDLDRANFAPVMTAATVNRDAAGRRPPAAVADADAAAALSPVTHHPDSMLLECGLGIVMSWAPLGVYLRIYRALAWIGARLVSPTALLLTGGSQWTRLLHECDICKQPYTRDPT